jgi:hypothetical protein
MPALQFLAFDYLVTPDYERVLEEKRRFLANEVRNPDLRNTKLDLPRVQALEQLLLDIRAELNEGRPPIEDDALWNIEELKHRRWSRDDLVRVAYLWSIADQLAQLRVTRVQAAWDPQEFQTLSAFAFGVPTRELWHVAVARVYKHVAPHLDDQRAAVSDAARTVTRWLPDVPPEVDTPPDRRVVDQVLADSRERFAPLAAIPLPTPSVHVPEWREQRIHHDDVRAYFAAGVKALGADGWTVVIDRRGGSRTTRNMSVNQERKQVVVPEGFALSPKRALALLAHEVGTHLARRVNGESTKLQLFGAGLDRYRPFEEGLAIAREGTLRGIVDRFDNPEAVLAIGLCRGMDGGEPRDFRGVFERMREYFYLMYVRKEFAAAEAREHADNAAWVRCVRTFRGTDFATPGVCVTLDLAYLAGSQKFWRFAAQHPQRLQDLNVGKFDPTEERHVWLLRELGLLDEERWRP